VKISVQRKKIVLLCRTVGFEKFSFTNGNRAAKKRRIPQYTKSSISKSVKKELLIGALSQPPGRRGGYFINYVSSKHNALP
jgi:hypothetical protein